MGILDSKKELAAMQEEIKQLRADVDRLKGLVLEIAKQVPAPSDPPQGDDKLFFGKPVFMYQHGDSEAINKYFK